MNVSIRFPKSIVNDIQQIAGGIDIGYQALIKVWLDDRLRQERQIRKQDFSIDFPISPLAKKAEASDLVLPVASAGEAPPNAEDASSNFRGRTEPPIKVYVAQGEIRGTREKK